MRRIWYPLFIVSFLITSQLARAGDPDFEIVSKTTFQLDERSDKWVVYSHSDEKRTYLSKRSTYLTSITLGEQYYSPISRINAYYNGDQVDGDNFSIDDGADEDVFISDYKRRKVVFSRNIKQGATAELEYQRSYSSAAFMPVMVIPNIDMVKEYTVVVEHPRAVTVGFEVFFPDGAIPYTIDSSDAKSTIITFKNIRSAEELVNYPFNSFRAAIKIHARGEAGEIIPTSPADFSRWYLSQFNQSPELPPEFATMLRGELDKARDPLEKLRVIYDYVRGTIRYIAEEDNTNAFVPREPGLVLKRGYGDCKDRAYLVKTLAKREGIDVKMVLVSTRPQPLFNGVDVSRFGHVICMYDGPAGRIYFDPTSKYTPFGAIPAGEIGAEGLVLDTTRSERVTIESPGHAPTIDIAIRASLKDLKNGKATVQLRSGALEVGNAAAEIRRAIDRENLLSNFITRYFSKISFDYFKIVSRTDSVITLTCDADLSEFLIKSDARAYLPRMPFRVVTTELLDREHDTIPLYASNTARLAMTIELEHPGYEGDVTTSSFGSNDDLGFTTSLARSSGDASIMRFDIAHMREVIPVAAKPEYFDFCRAVFKEKKSLFMLTRRGS